MDIAILAAMIFVTIGSIGAVVAVKNRAARVNKARRENAD